MKRFFVLLIALVNFTFATQLFSNAKFQFSTDYALFKYGDKYLLELYFSFYQKGLSFVSSDKIFEAAGLIDVIIKKKANSEIFYDALNKIPITINDTSVASLEQRFVAQKNVVIEPGEYVMSIIGSDYNNKDVSDTTILEIIIPQPSNVPFAGGIELSTSIKKSADTLSSFYKFGYEIIPNPAALYGNKLNSVYFYTELYGLNPENTSPGITIISSIANSNSDLVKTKSKAISKVSETMILFDSFVVDSLPTGSYILIVNAVDSTKNINLKSEKKLYIYNPNIKADESLQSQDADYLKSEFSVMKEDEVNADYELNIYLRTDAETKKFNGLTTLDDKRKFLYEFWKKRDKSPATAFNEYRVEYLTRVKETNFLFKEPFTAGWKTDRGRIYIIYGKPTEREEYPYEAEVKGYEIWHYDEIEGGTICVFVEKQSSGSGTYNLVHSTLRNEFRNDNWKLELK